MRFLSDDRPPTPRQGLRAPGDVVLELYNPDGRTLRGIGRLLDLSTVGVSVETTSEFNEDDDLVVRGMVNPETAITLNARVVWKRFYPRLYRYGLRLDRLTPDAREEIERFVGDVGARIRKGAPKIIHTKDGFQEAPPPDGV